MNDYNSMNKEQLRQACRDAGIRGYSSMTNEQKRRALIEHDRSVQLPAMVRVTDLVDVSYPPVIVSVVNVNRLTVIDQAETIAPFMLPKPPVHVGFNCAGEPRLIGVDAAQPGAERTVEATIVNGELIEAVDIVPVIRAEHQRVRAWQTVRNDCPPRRNRHVPSRMRTIGRALRWAKRHPNQSPLTA